MIPQPHKAEVWRPTEVQRTAQEIEDYTLVYEGVPCFVQPMDVKEAFYYEQRGQEGTASVYTVATGLTFQRNDIFETNGQQFHVLAVKPALFLGVYTELVVVWYPEPAKKRLNREAYG